MKSAFKATAILSGSSIVSILLSLVSSKVMALYLQPAGYGYYGLLQSFVAFSSLITGMGIATGIVRMGAADAARDDKARIDSLRWASWMLFIVLSGLALLLLVIFRGWISQWALGEAQHSGAIVLMGIALVFTVAGNIQSGILNAYHKVEALAKLGVINTVFGGVIAIGAIWWWRMQGVVPAVIAGAAGSCLASWYFLRREVGSVSARPSGHQLRSAASSLLRFGGPYTASMLLGTGVQLALPMVVLHLLGTESVGYYRAAAAISVGYLGFLITAMGQDYYPRLSAAAGQPATLVTLMNEQHRLVMTVSVPMILGTMALVPWLVRIVYSLRFQPAVEILEWQLIGDLFKFSSWTMSFAVLARCRGSVYFLIEAIGGLAAFGTTWLAVRWFGLNGLGIGFVATYVIYYFVVWAVVRRELPLAWTLYNRGMLLAGVAAAVIVRVLPATKFAYLRTPVALALALAFGAHSLLRIWREFTDKGLAGIPEIPKGSPSAADKAAPWPRAAQRLPGGIFRPESSHSAKMAAQANTEV